MRFGVAVSVASTPPPAATTVTRAVDDADPYDPVQLIVKSVVALSAPVDSWGKLLAIGFDPVHVAEAGVALAVHEETFAETHESVADPPVYTVVGPAERVTLGTYACAGSTSTKVHGPQLLFSSDSATHPPPADEDLSAHSRTNWFPILTNVYEEGEVTGALAPEERSAVVPEERSVYTHCPLINSFT
jgi:hypothetical protein